MNKTKIIEWVYNNAAIDQAIKRIVKPIYYDDFKSHLILQMMEQDEDKLIKLYNKNELIYFTVSIILNQWRSNSSSFWKIYRNNGFSGKHNPIKYTDLEPNKEISDDFDDLMKIDLIKLNNTVKSLLNKQYDDFLINEYHKRLFIMYYFENKTYRQIQKDTEINFITVRRSVIDTLKYVKKNILDK